jgi:hypothetical protein
MAKARKSPQQKKDLEYNKDHFTFSNAPHGFPKSWRQKKAQANRQYRRKSEELLAPAKRLISADDAEATAGDITSGHLKQAVARKRLRKMSTVTIGQKVKIKLEKRKESAGRRVNKHRKYDAIVVQALGTLTSLDGDQLADFLRRAVRLLQVGDPIEWMRVSQSSESLDRALYFLEGLERGNAHLHDALRRNQQLCEAFQQWRKEANRILRKEALPVLRKAAEKRALKRKLNAARRSPGN